MKYQPFDWDFAKETHSPETYAFLKLNHDGPMSEERFVEIWSNLPRTKRRASQSRAPSAARRIYRRLKAKFGFFGGVE